jgi:hypothetical protein
MTTLKIALTIWAGLCVAWSMEFWHGRIDAGAFTGGMLLMYAHALMVTAIVEGVALLLERFFE